MTIIKLAEDVKQKQDYIDEIVDFIKGTKYQLNYIQYEKALELIQKHK